MNFEFNMIFLMMTLLSPLVLLSCLIMSYNYLIINYSKTATEERKEKRLRSNKTWSGVFTICLIIIFCYCYVYIFIR